MTALRTKVPVGSAPWIVSERRQASELVEQDVEEFGYSVRNEMEWLNEHMHEIFTANQLNVSDIFKTPGKLRGKTPRTARKRNALGNRAPLTDIFAPNAQAAPSPTKTQFYKQIAQIQVAEDVANDENRPTSAAGPSKTHPTRGKENTDSGYHGITDDEMELGPVFQPLGFHYNPKKQVAERAESVVEPTPAVPTEERRVTEESFVSAKENLASRHPSQEDLRKEQEAAAEKLAVASSIEQAVTIPEAQSTPAAPSPKLAEQPAEQEPAEDNVDVDLDRMDEDDVHSPSEGSSPVKPLLRKSSLTFASLPAREPLANKKSIGARTSHVDQYKGPQGASRSSNLGRFTGGKSLGGQQHVASSTAHVDDDSMDLDTVGKPVLAREESETTKMHHQTTTQRLHDRINMLGQSRSSKSNPFGSSNAQPVYPQLPQAQPENDPTRPTTARTLPEQPSASPDEEADDEDWIVPTATTTTTQEKAPRPLLLKTRTVDQLPNDATIKDSNVAKQHSRFSPSKFTFGGHKKVMSASAISSPTRSEMAPDPRQQKPISVSNPPIQYSTGTDTPAGSPRRNLGDGPLSATKEKLYSALRTAKGIFASSAGVSAQAKMEALSSPAQRPKEQRQRDPLASPTMEHAPGPALYPNLGDASRVTSAESAASNSTEGRRTRSSSEREQKKKDEMRKAAGDLEKAREKERQKAAAAASKLQKSPSKEPMAQRPNAPSRMESERSQETNGNSADEMPPPPPPKSMLPTTQAQRMREPRRIAKPMKDAPSKTRPAPVTVRMPSQRMGQSQQQPSTASLSQSLQDTLPPPVPPKPTLTSKGSSISLHASSSTTSLKSSGSSQAAKRTLEAAAKKREADVKAAQRKAEQKREIEQRRAAKVEEERRREEEERRKQAEERRRQEDERRAEQQKRAAEQQRRDEAKRTAQKQAAEAKRTEQQRKENPRPQQNDFAHAMQQEKAQGPYGHPRADLGGARPISRLNLVQDPSRPPIQMNPAKPPKRALPADNDEQQARPTAQRNPPSYQQLDAKRRKTNEHEDEDELVDARRSVMAPPVRQSNIRKDNNKFPHGYAPAPAPAHPSASMYVKTVTAQHQQLHGKPGHPNDMAKFANARIPFADAPNPPAHAQHKTPGRPVPNSSAMSTGKHAKSSPHYPNGENINLPEIATDSEDEDSENEFQAPDWTDSPALREQLQNQQLIDPEQIFGPIAPLRMEEVFKNKERHKKFRDRTSSANWAGADRLTEEEKVKDKEARERLMRQGGWSFQAGT